MNAIVLGFSSRMGSGRRHLSKLFATALAWPRVSFGEYIRRIAREQGLGESREALQELGESFIKSDCEKFCQDVLQQAIWKPGEPLIVDGIRHKEVEEILARLVKPSILRSIFVDVDEAVRLIRLYEEDITDPERLERVEAHSTEAEVKNLLPSTADARLDGTLPHDVLLSRLKATVEEYEIKGSLDSTSFEEITARIIELSTRGDETALEQLRNFLLTHDDGIDKHRVPHIACQGLLTKGIVGVGVLAATVSKAPGLIYPAAIIEALWHAARGQQPPILERLDVPHQLKFQLSPETMSAARRALYDLIAESQMNEELFDRVLHFIYQGNSHASFDGKTGTDAFRLSVFEIFTESSIKITQRLIDEFETLINAKLPEKEYQQFLATNPVFIDPLASQVIDRQKLGVEHVTDFVVRRLDNEYILVEIEKPQDPIFTSKNDLTMEFNHSFGQVVDFLEWVDGNADYARKHMPCISSPKGLLVIGMRKDLSSEQSLKLKRYVINSRFIKIFTFDDLLERAKILYNNIHLRGNAIDCPTEVTD